MTLEDCRKIVLVDCALGTLLSDADGRAADFLRALRALEFRGTPAQAEAFHGVFVAGHLKADVARWMGCTQQSLDALLDRFRANCGRPIPDEVLRRPAAPHVSFVAPDLLDVLPFDRD